MKIVTMEQAKQHLRVDTDFMDADIELKLEAVSYLVFDFVKVPYDFYEVDDDNVVIDAPFPLRAAALVWLGILFKHRDGGSDESLSFGEIPKTVSNLLYMYRTPTIGSYNKPKVTP